MRITHDGHDYIYANDTVSCAITGAFIGEVYQDFAGEYWHYNGRGICGTIHVNENNALDNAIKSLIVGEC